MEEGKEASTASGLSGTSAAGFLWYSCGLCQCAFSADGAQAWLRGWMHQDPFPVGTVNKVLQYLTFHAELSSSAVPIALCLHSAFQHMQSQAVKIPLQWALAQLLYFLWDFEPTPPFYPQIIMNWGTGLLHVAQRTFRARCCAAVDEAWPGLGFRLREQALCPSCLQQYNSSLGLDESLLQTLETGSVSQFANGTKHGRTGTSWRSAWVNMVTPLVPEILSVILTLLPERLSC